MHWKYVCLYFLFLVVPELAVADDYWIHEKGAEWYADSSNALSFSAVQKKEFQTFENVITTGFDSITFWVKYALPPSSHKRVLEIITAQTEYVQVYSQNQTKPLELGAFLPFSKRGYEHKNFVIDLPSNDSICNIFIKVVSNNNVGLLFKVKSQQSFTNYSLKEYLGLGLYYGVLFLLLVYNLLLFLSIRDKVYLWYSLTVLMAVGISFTDDGLGFQFIWSEFPNASQPLGYYIFPIGFLTFYSLYAFHYLPRSFVSKRWLLYGVAALSLFFLILEVFIVTEDPFTFSYTFPFIYIYVFYWKYYLKGYRPARFFLLGNTFALIGVLINQMRLKGWVAGNIYTFYAFEVGMVLEFISLSLALADRFKQIVKAKDEAVKKEFELQKVLNNEQSKIIEIQKEKQELAEKVNRELEDKVQQRTEELESKNQQLNDLVGKLKELNIGYDKENWALKINLNEEKKSQILGKQLSFKEFLKVYPSDEKCRSFLSEHRWSNFNCNICGNDNFEVLKNYDGKCSKCGKKYTLTFESLFHRQKISLNKLMYLTYVFHLNSNHDAAELSEEIDVSTNSIYAFRKKVLVVLEKQKRPSKSWLDLVYS
jgi:transposase-like protein